MAHRTDADGLCEMSNLPPEQCAAPGCGPTARIREDVATDANLLLVPSQIIRRTVARHVSTVACGHTAYPSMTIALGPDGWVCGDCDPGTGDNPEPRDINATSLWGEGPIYATAVGR